MALTIQTPSFPNKGLYPLVHFHTNSRLSIRSEDPSIITEPTEEPSARKPASPGLGFGSLSSDKKNSSTITSKKKQSNGKTERASIIRRRAPVEKSVFVSEQGEGRPKEQSRNETAFLVTWLGLGALVIVEGIILAGSGLLPEEWDKFSLKYLYPSFTPTVLLFVSGTVVYGVSKYIQNENSTGQK